MIKDFVFIHSEYQLYNSSECNKFKQAEKLKSWEMKEGWMKNDEGWMKN